MRVFVAGFQHETNTFAATPAAWDAFERGDFFPSYVRGEGMVRELRKAALPTSGFLARAEECGCVIVPSCWAGATPSGRITEDAFERIRSAILDDLTAALASGTLDGIYLDLHGAAVCEHLDDPEAILLQDVRALAGVSMPIVASLDLHANVNESMLDAADYLVAYRTYPHVDMLETGRRAFDLLVSRRIAGTPPDRAFRRIPFLLPIVSQATLHEPAASIYALVADLSIRYSASASFAPGFPAADVSQCGASVWAYGPQAELVVETLERRIVDLRQEWRADLLEPDNAVKQALQIAVNSDGPVIIADVQDNPGAGADGNTTGLLHALLRAEAGRTWPGRVAFGLLYAPEAAAIASHTALGTTCSLALGAAVRTWSGELSEPALEANVRVRATSNGDAVFTGPMMHGATVKTGPSACVELDGILIGVASARTQTFDRSLFHMVGIDPTEMKIIVLKSAVHFRADFGAMGSACILAKSPGPMAADPSDLRWTKLDGAVEPKV